MNDRLADVATTAGVGLFLGMNLTQWSELTNIILGWAGIVSALAAAVYYWTNRKKSRTSDSEK